MYGSFIMKKRLDDPTFRKGIDDLPTVPIVLSEWTNLKPSNVQRMLRNANDWSAIKKGSTQSYLEAIKEGHFKTKVTNEWKCTLAMDVSDVYYDKFLINGADGQQLSQFKAGDKVRLRLSNGALHTLVSVPLLAEAVHLIKKYNDHPVSVGKGRLFPVISNQRMNGCFEEDC